MSAPTTVAFTICSNNYLGQALALKESFVDHHPEAAFYVVLVDKPNDAIDYEQVAPATVLFIEDIPEIDLQDLIQRYYIIELNTSVKPTMFKHLARKHPEATAMYYLDPDLYFYDSLKEVTKLLAHHSAALTPHILSPIPRDGKQPDENTFFRFGIYNLGFFGVNPQQEETKQLLDWWEARVLQFGYDRPNKGYFVDQLWMTQAPLFFRNMTVLTSFGYNMGPWNLHERAIVSRKDNAITLNDGSSLVFYHFSKLAEDDTAISREYDRYQLSDFPILKELYQQYKAHLERTRYAEYKKIPIAYPVKMNLKPEAKRRSIGAKILRKIGWRLIRWTES
ncbi:hypothetical protein [Altibacter sp. HG106]|uniref:hypothetical protein n=1 Tax=Altibacter sp. HG106 TaxID=3023937 RepID=UPI0023501685|nr:hypothetical protein [Altibacter sp. HG106]MDC7995716.1 hypothetical protein [Altibacter sp. HG106]